MDGITTAMSTFSAVGFAVLRWWDSVCVCVSGMNLKYALRWHIHISVHSVLCQCCTQAHPHIHPQTISGQWTNRAKSGYCHNHLKNRHHSLITEWHEFMNTCSQILWLKLYRVFPGEGACSRPDSVWIILSVYEVLTQWTGAFGVPVISKTSGEM